MARDYKNRAASKKTRKSAPVWIWLVIGYVLGGSSVAMIWWSQAPRLSQGGSWIGARPGSMQAAVPASESGQEDSPEIEPLQFDFYSLLPELEVVVPDEELQGKSRKPPANIVEIPDAEVTSVPKQGYLIQVSSFRSARDADRVKAQLALLGLYARVNKASIKGTTWHRVRVGPYNSAQAVKKARKQLASNGHNTMVIKIRPGHP